MCLPFSCIGVDYDGPVSYTGSPRRPDEVVDRLARLDPCGIKRSILTSKGHAASVEHQPATRRMPPAWSQDVLQAGLPFRRGLTGGTGGQLVVRSWKAQAGGACAAAGLPAPVVSTSQSESA